jgi:hypothetical protein
MMLRLALTAGLAVGALGVTGQIASALPLAQKSEAVSRAEPGGLLQPQPVQWRRCRYWRYECAERWGWRTPRYFVCLARHDCLE